MIIKLTTDKDLFSWLETKPEREWFDNKPTIIPVPLSIIRFNHMNNYTEEWYDKNMGSYLWFHFKN